MGSCDPLEIRGSPTTGSTSVAITTTANSSKLRDRSSSRTKQVQMVVVTLFLVLIYYHALTKSKQAVKDATPLSQMWTLLYFLPPQALNAEQKRMKTQMPKSSIAQ